MEGYRNATITTTKITIIIFYSMFLTIEGSTYRVALQFVGVHEVLSYSTVVLYIGIMDVWDFLP